MNDRPHYPWKEGDALFADELNAAIANAGGIAEQAAGAANVINFGADPTGVTDSSVAFNAAASHIGASGKRVSVYVPSGNYLLTKQVSLTDGQSLMGDGPGVTFLGIADSFDPNASSIILCTPSVIDPGPTIQNLTLWFYQPFDQASRANFKTLAAGGTSHSGGTGVQYPWAIATSGNSGRIIIRNVNISGAWNGINADGACYWIDGLRICAFNIGISIGGTIAAPVADWSHLSDIEFWVFGLNTTQLQGVYTDGNTIAMRIGAQNGLTAQNISCFYSQLVFTSDAGGGWFSFTNLAMDADGATIQVIGNVPWLQITNLYSTTGTVATRPQIAVTGISNVQISNFYSHSSSPYPMVSVAAGDTTIVGIQALPYANTSNAFAVSGTGTLRMNAARIFPGVTSAWTVPLMQQSGTGGLQIDNSQIQAPGTSGVAVSFGTDTIYNLLGNVVLSPGWTTAHPATPVNGVYGLLSLTASELRGTTSYANDAAAAAGGVGLDQLYRNGSAVQVRVT